uniref:Palmitoyltransferase n=2 Tax=Canis lupus familiaris TaxID=9615 RepID=A0A8I3Q3T2_CANLF
MEVEGEEKGGTALPLSVHSLGCRADHLPLQLGQFLPAMTHAYCAGPSSLCPAVLQVVLAWGDSSRQARQWSAAQRAFLPPSCLPGSSDPAPAGLLGRSSIQRCGGAGRWLCPGGCGAAADYFPGCQCSLLSSLCFGPTMPTSLNSAWFHLSYSDKERYENEERPEVQKQMLVDMAKKLPVYTRTGSGAVRFCDRCHLIKPDRCHHCSVCAMCVLKMDHHCPWVNNCIGFSNYKFFLQFLAYSVLYCLYIATTVFNYFIKYWRGELPSVRSKFHVLFLLFVACMFFVSLVILFGYHCWLVSRNKTTLEAFCTPVFTSGPEKNGFNLGFIKNIQQVFGDNKKFWLIPIGSSPGDGHSFPMRSMNESQNPLLANEEPWEDNEDENRDYPEASSSLTMETET